MGEAAVMLPAEFCSERTLKHPTRVQESGGGVRLLCRVGPRLGPARAHSPMSVSLWLLMYSASSKLPAMIATCKRGSHVAGHAACGVRPVHLPARLQAEPGLTGVSPQDGHAPPAPAWPMERT